MYNKVKSLRHNATMNALLSIMQIIFPLITFPYVSRVLGVEVNGRISFASSVVSYFTLFATLGMTTYGIKACARARDDKIELSKTVHELLILSTITTSIVFVALLISIVLVPEFRTETVLILINSLTLILNVAGMNWLYSGIEHYDYITIRSIFFKFIALVFMFAFVHNPNDIYIYAGITVFATVGPNIFNIIHSRKYITYRWIGHYNLKQHLAPVFALFVTMLAVNIYTNLDTVMLGFMQNDYQVGIYHASVRIKSVITTLVTSLGAVLLPRLSNYLKDNRQEDFIRILKKSFSFTCMAAFPIVVYFFMFAKESILLLSGEAYLDSVTPMQILIPLVAVTGFSNILGMQILVPTNREKFFSIAVTCGAVTDLILNFFLIPQYAAVGAAIATLIAELVQCGVQTYFARHEVKKFFDMKVIIQVLVSCIIAAGITALIHYFLTLNVFMVLLVTGIVFFAVYAVLLWLFKFDFFVETIEQITKGKIHR